MKTRLLTQVLCGLAIAATIRFPVSALAQEILTPDPPYQAKLERLAEVLGSIHFLRRLCGEESMVWRDSMGELIENEVPSADRKARLTASFNHGYRSFDGVYTRCTDAASIALGKFMAEGESLTQDIATRYGY